jgi:hypothetical protein
MQMIAPLPTFRTSRLVVRPRVPADLEACLAMDRDPAVTRFVAGPGQIQPHIALLSTLACGPRTRP